MSEPPPFTGPEGGERGAEVRVRASFVDEAGALLFEEVEREGSKPWVRRPDGNGGYIADAEGVRRVLLNLPAVRRHLEAGAHAGPLYLTEGTSDAHALAAYLEAHGLRGCVTTNPFGALSWLEEYSELLQGAPHVIAIVDNDESGRKRAALLERELGPVVELLECVRTPLKDKGADLRDHLEAELGLEELVELEPEAGATPEREPFRIEVLSAKELSELPPPAEEPELVGPFLRRGRITLLGATTGHGKTTFGAQMLAAGVLGGEFLGWPVEGGLRVLVLDLEQHLEDIREQLQAVGLAGSELIDYAPLPEGLQIDRDAEQLAELERVVAAQPYDIVRIDPFYKLHAADSSEELQARELVRLTRRWVNQHGFALLMDTHTRKRIEGRSGFTLDDLFGSSLFARDPEVILGLQLVEDGFSRVHIFKARGRRGEIRTGQVLELLYSDDELFRRKADEAERDLRAELTELGSDHAWRTLKEWKAKPGRADADRAAPNYVELRGGIGAAEANVKTALGELQVEEVFEYEEGPAERAPSARCWRLRPGAPEAEGTPGHPGHPELGRGSADATAPLTPTPKGSAVVQGSSPSGAPEAQGTLGAVDPDEWADRIRELGLDNDAGEAGGREQ